MNQHSARDALNEDKAATMRSRVQEILTGFAAKQRAYLAPRSAKDRLHAIALAYRDLLALGYELESVESLAPRHLAALARHWKEKGIRRETARTRWSHLTIWTLILGKAGMAPRFCDVWPRRVYAENDARPDDRGADRMARADGDRMLELLDDRTYAALLQSWMHRADLTGYWLVRCIKELRLNCEEAVQLQPACVSQGGDPVLVSSTSEGGQRTVRPDTPAKRELVVAMTRWMRGRGRARLGWPDHSVPQMCCKFMNLLNCAMRELPVTNDRGAETA
jgi:hypothetical protein